MGRYIQFVGRRSGEKSALLADGRKVKRNEVVEVAPVEARDLLRDPGANDDSTAEWVPAPRPEAD